MFSKDGTLWSPGENEEPNSDEHYMAVQFVSREQLAYTAMLVSGPEPNMVIGLDISYTNQLPPKNYRTIHHSIQQMVLDRWWRDRREFETTWLPTVKREYEPMKAEMENHIITGLLAEFEELQVFSNLELEPAADLPEEDLPKRGSKIFRGTLVSTVNARKRPPD
ncbi:hypothetical protein TWF106_011311 [Orbilia oligospora]|uniref:Uncharacterized protein n=1 Tax=Orbilia oligospora TaxID=2813651 RepID=A0A6G1M176_ORBOL|nr:hypothetical protein TWF106_011311 [Orbilia oligospora]KAF3209892.1 hypothetical protein TWF191_011321 [Orbilia oligospora]KAF3222931.1 hypothetical protein TWF679_004132 [Orbilia oligospora]KAF3239898.1 hypothetical protein TWF192_009668 [Orbilia oligospora]